MEEKKKFEEAEAYPGGHMEGKSRRKRGTENISKSPELGMST